MRLDTDGVFWTGRLSYLMEHQHIARKVFKIFKGKFEDCGRSKSLPMEVRLFRNIAMKNRPSPQQNRVPATPDVEGTSKGDEKR